MSVPVPGPERDRYMRELVAGITARIQQKADVLAARFRASETSTVEADHYFADQMRVIAGQAREKWEHASDVSWWDTASLSEVRTAYIAAVEYSGIDPTAADAAASFRDRFSA